MATLKNLYEAASRLAFRLQTKDTKLVLAESCTGGLISTALTRISGISSQFCGSAVVYQVETKAAWLSISAKLLKNPGPVSPEVARAMAEKVLEKTPQADVSAAVTGYLGPESSPGQDGLVFCAFSQRTAGKGKKRSKTDFHRLDLDQPTGRVTYTQRTRLRVQRQIDVSLFVVTTLCEIVESR